MRDIDSYFSEKEEPVKSCLQFLRSHILSLDPNISEVWRYKMPFYCFNGKRFCYLWVHKQQQQPYIGFVDGALLHYPELVAEKRARMKIWLFDPSANLPVKKMNRILNEVLLFYK